LPSCQALSQRLPSGYIRSDLTDFSLVVARVRAWRNNLGGKIPHGKCPRCVLACKPSVEVSAGGLRGIDASDFEFDSDVRIASRVAKSISRFRKDALGPSPPRGLRFPDLTTRSRIPAFPGFCSARSGRKGKRTARATTARIKGRVQKKAHHNWCLRDRR
jgi:hypothetical protein